MTAPISPPAHTALVCSTDTPHTPSLYSRLEASAEQPEGDDVFFDMLVKCQVRGGKPWSGQEFLLVSDSQTLSYDFSRGAQFQRGFLFFNLVYVMSQIDSVDVTRGCVWLINEGVVRQVQIKPGRCALVC